MIYFGIQKAYGLERLKATFKSKMAIFLITFGVLGMTVALTIAGYEQVLVERAELGGTWEAFFTAQDLPWLCLTASSLGTSCNAVSVTLTFAILAIS